MTMLELLQRIAVSQGLSPNSNAAPAAPQPSSQHADASLIHHLSSTSEGYSGHRHLLGHHLMKPSGAGGCPSRPPPAEGASAAGKQRDPSSGGLPAAKKFLLGGGGRLLPQALRSDQQPTVIIGAGAAHTPLLLTQRNNERSSLGEGSRPDEVDVALLTPRHARQLHLHGSASEGAIRTRYVQAAAVCKHSVSTLHERHLSIFCLSTYTLETYHVRFEEILDDKMKAARGCGSGVPSGRPFKPSTYATSHLSGRALADMALASVARAEGELRKVRQAFMALHHRPLSVVHNASPLPSTFP